MLRLCVQVETLQAAIEDLDNAISIEEDFFEAYNNRGSCQLDLGDAEGASGSQPRIELNNEVG